MTKWQGRVITCSRCGLPGGTLVKVSDEGHGVYSHPEGDLKCALLRFRKKSTQKEGEDVTQNS